MIIDELVAILGYKMASGSEAEIRKYEGGLKRVEQAAARVGEQMARVAALAGAAVAAGFTYLGKEVLDAAAKFEQFSVSLETIEGSADKAKKSMDWIAQFAKVTPYNLEGVTQAFIKLKAYGLEPTDGTLRILGDTASAMSKPLNQAVEAFADAATFEFERLKEFGITSKQQGEQVTFSWTENGKALTKTVKKNADDVRKFLLETWGKRFGDAMEKQSKTFAGMMSNLGDAWTGFERKIADKGFFDYAKRQLQLLLDTIDRWDKDGTLDKAAKAFSNLFETVGNVLTTAFERISTHVDFISKNWEKAKPILQGVALGLAALLFFTFPLTAAIAAAALALDDFFTYLEGGDSVIGDFLRDYPKLADFFRDLGDSIKYVFGDKGLGADPWKEFRQLGELWKSFEAQWDALQKKRDEFFEGIGNLTADIALKLKEFGKNMGKAVLEGLKSMKDEFLAWFTSILPDWMTNLFKGGGSGFSPTSYSGAGAGGGSGGGMFQRASYSPGGTGREYPGASPGSPGGGGSGLPSAGGAAAGTKEMMGHAMDQLRKEGVPEANLKAAAAHLVGQATVESHLNPRAVHDQGTGYGIYGARLERRTRMFNWLQAHGYAKDSSEGQMRYMAHEAMTDPSYRRTAEVLKNADPSRFGSDAMTITKNFEAPKVNTDRSGHVADAYASGAAGAPQGTGGDMAARIATLNSIMGASNAAGLKTTSGYRGPDHPLTRANPRSKHAQGMAFDLQARTEAQADEVMARQRELFKARGLEEGRDYSFIDEVRNKSAWATGKHVHAQMTPSGMARYQESEKGGGALTNFDQNTGRMDGASAGATINTDRSSTSGNVSVQAPVNVHVAKPDDAPEATARAVGQAVIRGASYQAQPARMQGSAAA